MKKIDTYKVVRLNKELCEKKLEEILNLLKLIPESNYKKEDILSEKKGERVLLGKWEYSLLVLDREKVIGVLIAYERAREENGLYNENCFYINEVAVLSEYKGQKIGKSLLKIFIENVEKYNYLDGELKIRIQTTNSDKNKKVIDLYKSVGFKKIGIKTYPSKEDIVLEIKKL